MKATRVKMSAHVIEDRLDRLTFIAVNVGFGEVILEHTYQRKDRVECLTNTGVLIVKSLTDNAIITAFIPDIDKVSAMYMSSGYTRVPGPIYTKVVKNQRYQKMQNSVRY